MPQDIVSQIVAYESGEMSPLDHAAFFQSLIDSGTVWHLQGSYQREAVSLMRAGICTPAQE